MKEEILMLLVENISEIVFTLIGALISVYLIPWLKEKKIYDEVKIAVGAAEKLAENCEIDKLEWVKKSLASAGVKITPTIERMIECAVTELDALIKNKSTAN